MTRTGVRWLVLVPVLLLAFPAVGGAATRRHRPPAAVRSFAAVPSYGVYGNAGYEAVGDCTVAAVGDILQTWARSDPFASAPFLDVYHRLVRGPGGPLDGLYVAQVLNYWKHFGIDGYKIATWKSIAPYRSRKAIERAIAQFGAVYGSFEIPTADSAPSTGVWTLAAAPKGSTIYGPHAMAVVGYDRTGPYVVAWGTVQHVTWAWWQVWADAAAVVVPRAAPWKPHVLLPTTTMLAQVTAPTADAWAVRLTATVVGDAQGTIDFEENGVSIPDCQAIALTGGTATCAIYVPDTFVGLDTFYAHFTGDATHADSWSNETGANFEGAS